MLETDLIIDVFDGANVATTKSLMHQILLPFIPIVGIKLDFTPTEIENVEHYTKLKQTIEAPVEYVDIIGVLFIVQENKLHLSGEVKTGNPDQIEATLELLKRYYGFHGSGDY